MYVDVGAILVAVGRDAVGMGKMLVVMGAMSLGAQTIWTYKPPNCTPTDDLNNSQPSVIKMSKVTTTEI